MPTFHSDIHTLNNDFLKLHSQLFFPDSQRTRRSFSFCCISCISPGPGQGPEGDGGQPCGDCQEAEGNHPTPGGKHGPIWGQHGIQVRQSQRWTLAVQGVKVKL